MSVASSYARSSYFRTDDSPVNPRGFFAPRWAVNYFLSDLRAANGEPESPRNDLMKAIRTANGHTKSSVSVKVSVMAAVATTQTAHKEPTESVPNLEAETGKSGIGHKFENDTFFKTPAHSCSVFPSTTPLASPTTSGFASDTESIHTLESEYTDPNHILTTWFDVGRELDREVKRDLEENWEDTVDDQKEAPKGDGKNHNKNKGILRKSKKVAKFTHDYVVCLGNQQMQLENGSIATTLR
jgi:hypothetical protein